MDHKKLAKIFDRVFGYVSRPSQDEPFINFHYVVGCIRLSFCCVPRL